MTAPPPPSDLPRRKLTILEIAEGVAVERLFEASYEPIFFDKGRGGRWNAPDGAYGVLYVAADMRGAFAETFLREPGRTLLPLDLVARKARVTLRTTRPLRLIALTGSGLARAGATAEVTHGGLPYDIPQAWSKALRDHPAGPDGIAWRARHDDDTVCYALFDHPPTCVEEIARELTLTDRDWFWTLADKYAIGIAPT